MKIYVKKCVIYPVWLFAITSDADIELVLRFARPRTSENYPDCGCEMCGEVGISLSIYRRIAFPTPIGKVSLRSLKWVYFLPRRDQSPASIGDRTFLSAIEIEAISDPPIQPIASCCTGGTSDDSKHDIHREELAPLFPMSAGRAICHCQ